MKIEFSHGSLAVKTCPSFPLLYLNYKHVSNVKYASKINLLAIEHTSVLFLLVWLLPPANEVWGKVMFSEASVCHSVHREAGGPRGCRHLILDADPLYADPLK